MIALMDKLHLNIASLLYNIIALGYLAAFSLACIHVAGTLTRSTSVV